jgi:hypothetical protein
MSFASWTWEQVQILIKSLPLAARPRRIRCALVGAIPRLPMLLKVHWWASWTPALGPDYVILGLR